jgi:alanine-glyoxylate transaminase/serine-glyoxylate transaminase/serine-pyruvate transaminase
METAIANLVTPGSRATVVVSGYFGDRLAQMLARYGAQVTRVEGEWGRAADPQALRRSLQATGADIVAVVHAETSTGVLHPVDELCAEAHAHGAMTIVDAVTSLGAHPVETTAWQCDACYSCSQKGLGAPSGLSPIVFSARALEASRRSSSAIPSRPFYFDLQLLQDYWVHRKYHHTISAPLVYALAEALAVVSEEGLEARWQRHEQTHQYLVEQLAPLGLDLLPPVRERLWSLNAVRVPQGVDEGAVRRQLLDANQIEIGAGLGPLAGRIWRVGLMGSGATRENVDRLTRALGPALPRD